MPEETPIYAGLSYWDITPPIGGDLSGYGFFLNRKSTLVKQPLSAVALVLEQGETRLAIITADLIAVNPETTEKTRAAIAARTGIPPDNVMISCSHTHSGPATLFLHGCGELDSSYVAILPRYFASVVEEAVNELQPVNISVGETTLTGLAKNRVDPQGKVDTSLQVMELTGEDARYALFAFSCHPVTTPGNDSSIAGDFPAYARELLTECGEYDGAAFLQGCCGDINPTMAHTNENEMRRGGRMMAGAALMAMAQAAKVENLAPLRALRRSIELPLSIPTPEELQQRRDKNRALLEELPPDTTDARTARFWMEATEGMLQQLTGEPDPWLEILRDAQQQIELRAGREPRLNELAAQMDLPPDSVAGLLALQKRQAESGHTVPQTLTCEIQAFRMGDVAILAHPTELFVEFGLEIKARSPFPHTFVTGYTNNFLGYIPNEAEFARQGYAAATVPYMLSVFPYAPDVGRVFVEECVRLLNDLYQS